MSMEFDRAPAEYQKRPHENAPHTAESLAFEGGAQETVIAPTTTDALTARPEPTLPEYRPVATARERAAMGEQPVYMIDGQSKKLVLTAEEQDSLKQAISTSRLHRRRQILDNFEPQRGGLDLERGDEFIQSLGLAATTTTVELPVSSRASVDKIHPLGPGINRTHGIYSRKADIALTFRNPRLEELNGPEISERMRVHELAHSSEDAAFFFRLDRKPFVTQGYNDIPFDQQTGSFLDEGVVDMIAGEYVTDVLDEPYGLLDLPTDTCRIFRSQHRRMPILMPSHYVFLNETGEYSVINASYAAAGLEELIDRDPALRLPLIGGLYDPEARKEVAGRINAIQPGLFDRLHRDPLINGDHYALGLEFIRDALK